MCIFIFLRLLCFITLVRHCLLILPDCLFSSSSYLYHLSFLPPLLLPWFIVSLHYLHQTELLYRLFSQPLQTKGEGWGSGFYILPFLSSFPSFLLIIFDRWSFKAYSCSPSFNVSIFPSIQTCFLILSSPVSSNLLLQNSHKLCIPYFPHHCLFSLFHNVILSPSLPPSLPPTFALTRPLSHFAPILSFLHWFLHSLNVSPSVSLSPCHSHISLYRLIFFFYIFSSFIHLLLSTSLPAPPPRPCISFPSLLPSSSPLPEVLAVGPSLPICIGINVPHHKATSQLFLFFNHCNPFNHQPQELIKHSNKISLLPLVPTSQCQVMDGWSEWVPAVM